MKYFIFILALLFMASCSSKSHLTLMSNDQINMNDFSVNTNNRGNFVEGVDKHHLVVFFPIGAPPVFSDAYNNALEGKNANMLVDVNLSQLFFYIPYIYGQNKLEITGYETK